MEFEHDEKRRRQFIKVVIAEIAMVMAVIVIVIVATLASMGFFVNSEEWKIEQSGLLQLHSLPTGASVELDGETLFFRTNLSRTLPEGKHQIRLSRDGYDTWQKEIEMRPGVLLRVYYPRLFLQQRTPVEVADLGEELAFLTVSRDRSTMLYAAPKATTWQLIDIRGDEAKRTELDLTKILPGVKAGEFQGEVVEFKWGNNSDRVLLKIAQGEKIQWLVLDLKDVKASLNLTETFGMDFAQIELVNGSMGQLFALRNRQLYRIDVTERKMSGVLLSNVERFSSFGSNLIYLAQVEDEVNKTKIQQVGVYRDGEKGGTVVATVPAGKKVLVALTKYYDQDYLAYTVDNELTIYYGKLPTYSAGEADLAALGSLLEKRTLAAAPTHLSVSPAGEYIVARREAEFMVADVDTGEVYEYQAPNATLRWLDDSMMYAVVDGQELEVWDFDSTNQRTLVTRKPEVLAEPKLETVMTKNTDEPAKLAAYDVAVAPNERWLYYVVQNQTGLTLMREQIRD